MKKILNNVLVVIILTSLSSCAAIKNSTMVKFKEIIKDVDVKTENEIILAQHLYNEIRNK